jgi:signal transduction histidine kinase
MNISKKMFFSMFGQGCVVLVTQIVVFHIASGSLPSNEAAIIAVLAALVVSGLAAYILCLKLASPVECIESMIDSIIGSGDIKGSLGGDSESALGQKFNQLLSNLQNQQEKIIGNERERVLSAIASQIAHDVRSPLVAFETVLANTKGIEEEKRVMLRIATKRIKDIANNLLEVYKLDGPSLRRRSTDKRPCHLGMLVEAIVSEKRVRYSDYTKLQIDSEIAEDALDLFLDVDQSDMKRVLSILVDNAVEANRNRQCNVLVRLLHINGIAVLHIKYTGNSMHPDKIKKILSDDKSATKEDGPATGLAYVQEKSVAWDAEFQIESSEDRGTMIKFRIRSAPPPTWFTSVIHIRKGYQVLIADDDPSIHQVWKSRLSGQVEPLSFTTIATFEAKVKELLLAQAQFVCLVDYEFIGEARNGVEAIKSLGIANTSVLVTSRHDEELVMERCTDLRIKMIPKGIAPVIPIKFVSNEVKYIFLDDDPFIVEAWEMDASMKKVDLTTFVNYQKLLDHARALPTETLFYLDHNLGGDVSGIDVAKKLHEMGFREIFLSTGYDPTHFKDVKVVKGVFGKEPPF